MEARGNTFVPVIKERVAVPAMPAVPVLPGGPHEDRAVLEQAMDDQPMELAEEERVRGFANPNRPDEETVERHNLTHLPAAAWCDICVRSRGRDAPHREAAAAKIDAVRPCGRNYAEQGKSNQPHDNVKALVAIDRSSGAIYASGVMQKGDDGGYVTQSLSVWIASLGYTMVTLHSDKEPAICWVRDKVQANLIERGMSVTTRASPTHSHESNGGAERAVQSVRGLARTLVTQVEYALGSFLEQIHLSGYGRLDMLDGS